MSEHDRLRKILEPAPPRLGREAADRLDARIDQALRAPGKPWWRRGSLALAPALAALLVLVLLKPWAGGDAEPDFFLLDEESYLSALVEYQEEGGTLDGIFDVDEENDDYNTESWSDADWSDFQAALEDFQFSDNGGTR